MTGDFIFNKQETGKRDSYTEKYMEFLNQFKLRE